MQVIPAIDVLDGKVVRLLQGSFDDVTTYGSDPAGQLDVWALLGATLVHVVDLAGARSGHSNGELLHVLGAADVPFQFGGGIRSAEDADAAVDAGAVRVVIGTSALWSPSTFEAILSAVGSARVVAALDVFEGKARGEGWFGEGISVQDVAIRLQAQGVERALVTGIGVDGTMRGPDLETMCVVRKAAPELQLIGSGGIGSIADLLAMRAVGAEGAIVGRALYEGRFTLTEALEALAQEETNGLGC